MCGALSGACMAAGLLFGYDSPRRKGGKAAHYARIRTIADAFRAEFGTILCRDILGLGASEAHGAAAAQRILASVPCADVAAAARILDECIAAQPSHDGTAEG